MKDARQGQFVLSSFILSPSAQVVMSKHIPQRTCIGCRQVEAKRELMRIVRTPEGRVVADPTGKLAGRGAYVHKARDCWEAVLNARGRLEHALNMEAPLPAEDRARLEQAAVAFPPRAGAPAGQRTEAAR